MKLTDKMDTIQTNGNLFSPGAKRMESFFIPESLYTIQLRIQTDFSSLELG